jgi:hypothetical protein
VNQYKQNDTRMDDDDDIEIIEEYCKVRNRIFDFSFVF